MVCYLLIFEIVFETFFWGLNVFDVCGVFMVFGCGLYLYDGGRPNRKA